jgi:hypothetical protein
LKDKWISAKSCWELAKLVEKKRIGFSIPLLALIRRSLNEFNIRVADPLPGNRRGKYGISQFSQRFVRSDPCSYSQDSVNATGDGGQTDLRFSGG